MRLDDSEKGSIMCHTRPGRRGHTRLPGIPRPTVEGAVQGGGVLDGPAAQRMPLQEASPGLECLPGRPPVETPPRVLACPAAAVCGARHVDLHARGLSDRGRRRHGGVSPLRARCSMRRGGAMVFAGATSRPLGWSSMASHALRSPTFKTPWTGTPPTRRQHASASLPSVSHRLWR
jgi:hypothetical protein